MASEIPPPPINLPQAKVVQLLAIARERGNQRLTDVLRCHLVLENAVEWACEKRLADASKIKKFNYASKVDLLEALYGDEIDQRFYKSCKNIGLIRNKLAHNLNEEDYEDQFLAAAEQELPNMPAKSRAEIKKIERNGQDEIFIYRVIHTAQGIIEVSHEDEIKDFEKEMTNWMETYLK